MFRELTLNSLTNAHLAHFKNDQNKTSGFFIYWLYLNRGVSKISKVLPGEMLCLYSMFFKTYDSYLSKTYAQVKLQCTYNSFLCDLQEVPFYI